MEQKKERWSSSFGFLMAAVGAAVGLGNLWRFPYSTGENGGFIFLLIYLLFVCVIGFPIMVGEISIGRFTRLNARDAYGKIDKRFRIVGSLGIVTALLILSFYSVIGGWVSNYIVRYATNTMPHSEGGTLSYFTAFTQNTWTPILWTVVFIVACALVVMRGVAGGIEKFSKVAMPLLLVMLLIIIVRAVTLPGAGAGLSYLFKPDFSHFSFSTVTNAMGQVFFSLSMGMGCMITYGSYLRKKDSIERSAALIPAFDTLIAVLASMAILPAVFAFGQEPSQGPGLVFNILPTVFEHIPGGVIFGLLFFILVFFAAITSAISLIEIVVSFAMDRLGMKRWKAACLTCLLVLALAVPCSLANGPLRDMTVLGMDWMTLMDKLTSVVLMPLQGVLMCVFIGYIWGVGSMNKEVEANGRRFYTRKYCNFIIKYVAPLSVLVVFVSSLYENLSA